VQAIIDHEIAVVDADLLPKGCDRFRRELIEIVSFYAIFLEQDVAIDICPVDRRIREKISPDP
jgi:hypothetical protein